MQAVILAAGKSTRTYPLTATRPKPLLKVANKTLLEHNLDNMKNIVDEVIIVVGYKKNLIKKHIGSKYKNLKIRFIEQRQQLGTGHAALLAERYIKDRFILMAGDDIYSENDIKRAVRQKYSILVNKTKNWRNFGVVLKNKEGALADFVEKPDKFVSDLINTAFYVLDKKIFAYLHEIKKTKRNEYEFPDALKKLAKDEKVHCVMATQWMPVAYPWDLLRADIALRKNKNIIGKNSKITGKVINSTVGEGCTIKGIVKNSIIMDNSFIEKGSIVENSVIGENVYFKGGIMAKNSAVSHISGKKIKTGRFGAAVGDNSRLSNVQIGPGCRISPNKSIKNRKIRNDVL